MSEEIKSLVSERDRFAKLCGIELLEVSKGKAKAKMDVKEHHLNGVDITQGGAIFTLADLVFAAASNSHGTIAVGVNANITYFKATTKGTTLFAEGKEVSINPKLATYLIDVTDESGEMIAVFKGTVYRKKESLV